MDFYPRCEVDALRAAGEDAKVELTRRRYDEAIDVAADPGLDPRVADVLRSALGADEAQELGRLGINHSNEQ